MALVSLFFLGREKDYRKEVSIDSALSYMEDISIIGKKNGTDPWIVSAKKAAFSKDESTALIDSITIDIPGSGVNLNADKGTYNLYTNDLHLNDNITIRTRDSMVYVKSLKWNPSTETLASDNNVQIKGSKFRIEGDGFATSENKKIKLMKNVKATFF